MQNDREFYGIVKSAAPIKAFAVSLSSWQALRNSYQISYDPDVLVSQNSIRHYSNLALVKGVSYDGVLFMPSPVKFWPPISFSTLLLVKYWILYV